MWSQYVQPVFELTIFLPLWTCSVTTIFNTEMHFYFHAIWKKYLYSFSKHIAILLTIKTSLTDLICHLYYIVNSHMHKFPMFCIDLFPYSSINTIFFINKDLWWKSLDIILFSSLFSWLFHTFNLWDEISNHNVKT